MIHGEHIFALLDRTRAMSIRDLYIVRSSVSHGHEKKKEKKKKKGKNLKQSIGSRLVDFDLRVRRSEVDRQWFRVVRVEVLDVPRLIKRLQKFHQPLLYIR